MRVLFLTNYSVAAYGVAEVVNGLSAGLGSLGVAVHVYGCHESARAGHLTAGQPCVFGPFPKPSFFATRRSVRPILEVCKRERIDLIHCHGLYRSGYAARLVKKANGIPYVVTSHNDLSRDVSKRMRRFGIRKRCQAILRDAAAVTHLNAVVARAVLDLADVAGKSVTIPNGIDVAWWQEPLKNATGNYILALGRLVRDKGFHVLIDALQLLKDRVSLVLAGAGVERDALESRAREAGMPVCTTMAELTAQGAGAVCFPGLLQGEEKRDWFRGCKLVAFPSQPSAPEALPMVLLEGMAAGKAIVASDIPCARDILKDGRHAVLVPPADARAWAQALENLLTEGAHRKRLEDGNRIASQELDWSVIARRYLAVYQRVLGTTEIRWLQVAAPVQEGVSRPARFAGGAARQSSQQPAGPG